tara:strand:+ start:290 stop:670 length:381 start_codon:yes stop_codon:yes gene_type:complete
MSNIWDKYKSSEEPVICMVGVIALCVSLCKSDGNFTDDEYDEILKIIPHTENEREYIVSIIQEIDQNNLDAEFHAENIKKYLPQQPRFLDFILATMYKLALVDHVLDKQEVQVIQKIKKIFYREDK